MDKDKILKSKHFCMLPWVHTHLLPSSQVLPCCVWPYDKPVGNAKESSLKEIWNNAEYKEIRRQMLNDEAVENCHQCYERDGAGGHSLRKSSNQNFRHLFDEVVAPSVPTGELKAFKMAYFDIRFSNICNFKCRGCSPELSSSWKSDHEKLYNYKSDKDKLISVLPNVHLWDELIELLPTVENAYFAGGEPLIMDEHYLILEELIKLKKTSIPLSYNSNMSNLRFRDKKVTDYWNHFKQVYVGISIDDVGSRGEYFRNGMDWGKTLENIKFVQEKCPHVIFSVNCTVGNTNIFYLPELYMTLIKEKVITHPANFFVNLMLSPEEYRAQVLPPFFKEKVAKKIKDFLDTLKFKVQMENWQYQTIKNAFESAVNFMNQDDMSRHFSEFKRRTVVLDEIRNENFRDVFPEMAFLLD